MYKSEKEILPTPRLERILNRIYRQQERLIVTVGLLAVIVVAVVDYRTEYQIGFSIFYLFPIFIATVYVCRRAGIVIALASAFAWVLSDLLSGHSYTTPELGGMNMVVRVGFFALIAFSLISLKRSLDQEKRLASIDFLTGIGNARAFNDYLQKEHTGSLSIAYLDCDNFKMINDTMGASQG